MSKLSFSFKKKVEKPCLLKTNTSIVAKEDLIDHAIEEPDYITAINDRVIESSKKKKEEEEEELIIPCIRVNNWRATARRRDKQDNNNRTDSGNDLNTTTNTSNSNQTTSDTLKPSLDQLAQEALLREATGNSGRSEGDGNHSQASIPLLVQNRVPIGFEEDGNFDVSARAPEPSREDYEAMPVEQFGMAMLRGMGAKAGDRQEIRPLNPKIRAKGMGLGADVPLYKQKRLKNGQDQSGRKDRHHRYIPGEDDEEDAAEEERRKRQRQQEEEEVDDEIRSGALIQVQAGEHKFLYGVVESVGEDLSNSVVRLTLKKESAIIANPLLKVVSKKEFDKYCKQLNKDKVDQYYRDKKARGEIVY